MTTLLITGGGGAGSEALWRYLSPKYDLHFADADSSSIPPVVPDGHRHGIPLAGPDWAEGISSLSRSLGVDLLIPTVDEELYELPQLGHRSPHLGILSPPQEFIESHLDKLRSNEVLINHGLGAPKTRTFEDLEGVTFPLLVKPRQGRGSRGVQVLESYEECEAYRTLAKLDSHQILAQELLKGQEWTVCVSADGKGNLCGIVPVKVESKRGITMKAKVEYSPEVIAYCRNLHDQLRPYGCYNVQAIQTRNGTVGTFEINPRVSTTFCMALAVGLDPIKALLSEPGSYAPALKQECSLSRSWHNQITLEGNS